MRRLVLLALGLTLFVAACGDSASDGNSAPVKLNASLDGAVVFLPPEGELSVRLRVEEGIDWEMTQQPDPEILVGGDSYVFVPSDPDGGSSYRRFDFTAASEGETSLAFERTGGDQERSVSYTIIVQALETQ